MQAFPHHYDTHLSGGPSGYATVSTAGLPDLRAAPPRAFDGPGDAWSPEHLLLASVQTCFLFTLRAVARNMKVEFTELSVDVSGTVDRSEGVTRFTDIVMRATVTLRGGVDRAVAVRALEKSERACLVSASLSTPVRLEIVEVKEQPGQPFAAPQ